MFVEVEITNFRCFKSLRLGGLKRINLITGPNNSGKTSFLEALYLNLGGHNPGLSVKINVLRGIERFALNPEDVWGWLFFERLTSEMIEVACTDESGVVQRVSIRLGPSKRLELPVAMQPELLTQQAISGEFPRERHASSNLRLSYEAMELQLSFQSLTGQKVESKAYLNTDGEIKISASEVLQARRGSFQSTRVRPFKENAEQYTRVRTRGDHKEVVAAIKCIDPRVKGLEILALGGEPILHADMGTGQPIPTPMMGEGFTRVLSIILAILDSQFGVVLVDEIENGLHYTTLENVWKAIDHAAKIADVQVFCTSHSEECIDAAHTAFSDSEDYSFAVVQLFRLKNGEIGRVLDQKHIAAAVDANIDLR